MRLGFVEGQSNTHPGQGTANRRFFFDNFMLELLWVENPAEAQSERTRRTRLWDRWERRERGGSPFGIIFAPMNDEAAPAPFPAWSYTPDYLPSGMSIQIAEGTTLNEPELFYLPFLKRGRDSRPVMHALPIREASGLRAGVPSLSGLSAASRSAQAQGLLEYFESPQHVLEILFAASSDLRFDLRPDLPLVFRGAVAQEDLDALPTVL